jgi:hypothetical protein
MIEFLSALVGASLMFVGLGIAAIALTRARAHIMSKDIAEALVLQNIARKAVEDNAPRNIKPPHRPYSISEMSELAGLINTFCAENPRANQAAVTDAIIALSEVYDDALKLRYGVKG